MEMLTILGQLVPCGDLSFSDYKGEQIKGSTLCILNCYARDVYLESLISFKPTYASISCEGKPQMLRTSGFFGRVMPKGLCQKSLKLSFAGPFSLFHFFLGK